MAVRHERRLTRTAGLATAQGQNSDGTYYSVYGRGYYYFYSGSYASLYNPLGVEVDGYTYHYWPAFTLPEDYEVTLYTDGGGYYTDEQRYTGDTLAAYPFQSEEAAQVLGNCRLAAGSYVGDGTGAVTLTFPFTPKVWGIYGSDTSTYYLFNPASYLAMVPWGQTVINGFRCVYEETSVTVTATSESFSADLSGTTYHYWALG